MSYFVPSVTLLVAFVMAAGPGSQERQTQLHNAGFESAVLREGWTVHVSRPR
jgi:hypothetical protein